SESSSWMSSNRQGAPLIEYSLSPERKRMRLMVTSAMSSGSLPDELSMVRVTSARPSGGRIDVPAKMTSSILAERSARGPWAPITQVTASTTLDLPLPLGPTTTVIPGSNSRTVGSANDLNPFMVRDLRNIAADPTNLADDPYGPRCVLRFVARNAHSGNGPRPGSARRRTSSGPRCADA